MEAIKVNVDQCQRIMALTASVKIPLAVVGSTGCGKTDSVIAFAKRLGAKLVIRLLSYADRSDIGGIPVPMGDRAKFLIPEGIPLKGDKVKEDQPIVLFLDEFDRAPADVQNAALQLLLGGELNGHRLHENVLVVLAMNGVSDLYTTPLSEAARTRICTVFMEPDWNQWDEWAYDNKVHPAIRALAKYKRDTVERKHEFFELAVPNPRTLTMAATILTIAKEMDFETEDILLPTIAGLIGQSAALETMGLYQRMAHLPTPEDCIFKPTLTVVPSDPIDQWLIAGAVAGLLKGNGGKHPAARANLEKGVTYISRVAPEIGYAVFRKMEQDGSPVAATKQYQSWWSRNSQQLGGLT